MGSTVTTGRRAAAFTAPSGKIIFVLYEQTYEKNVSPHTPHWSCLAIGNLPTVLPRIFGCASACEGGMLQNRSGRITPEGYIQSWMKELAAPAEFGDRDIRIQFERGSIYVSIPVDGIEEVKESLTSLGRLDLLELLVSGETVTLQLYKDVDVVTTLYAPSKLPPWRILSSSDAPSGEGSPRLGYAPKPAKTFEVQVPKVLRVGREDRILQREDGSWYCAGWAYSVVSNFVEDLWEAELREPGSYYKRIKAYRNAIQNAPLLPLESAKVVVDSSVPLKDYQQRSLAEFQKNHPVIALENGFEVHPTEECLYHTTNLPNVCTHWEIAPEWLATALPLQF
jgi:hypothetical protein